MTIALVFSEQDDAFLSSVSDFTADLYTRHPFALLRDTFSNIVSVMEPPNHSFELFGIVSKENADPDYEETLQLLQSIPCLIREGFEFNGTDYVFAISIDEEFANYLKTYIPECKDMVYVLCRHDIDDELIEYYLARNKMSLSWFLYEKTKRTRT